MIKQEQIDALDLRMHEYRKKSFDEIAKQLTEESPYVDSYEVKGISGADYQIEVSVSWATSDKKSIEILGFISADRPWWKSFFSNVSNGFTIDSNGVVHDL